MKDFNKLVFDSLTSVLDQVFGIRASKLIMDSISQSGYRYAKSRSFEDINSHLEKLFNSKISSVLYRASIKKLHNDMQQEYLQVEEYFNFLDSIYKAKVNVIMPAKSKASRVLN